MSEPASTNLQRSCPAPWVDIDLGAVCANYAFIRKQAATAEIAAVVKCNGYGLGANRIAQALAERENCRTFFVTYPEEGAALRIALGPHAPDATIYIFNGADRHNLEIFSAANLVPVLNSLEQAQIWVSAFPNSPAALHIDTGMNRLGAPLSAVSTIAGLQDLRIDMVMSHLACVSEPSHPKNAQQRARFRAVAEQFPHARKSFSASGGALLDESYHFDLARPGIALYGGSPFDNEVSRLSPVVTLKAPVVQIREAAAGETVGYAATHTFTRPTRLATVSLGYGDGFPRTGSNRAGAFLGGGRAPLVGRVSMDLIVLDITDAPEAVSHGDAAEFFGPNLSIHKAAQDCDTISYELLTGLGARVDRRYQ